MSIEERKSISVDRWTGDLICLEGTQLDSMVTRALGLQAAGIEIIARVKYEAGLLVKAIEVSRTGISFKLAGIEGEGVWNFMERELPILTEDFCDGGMVNWMGSSLKGYTATDGKRLGYFFPMPKGQLLVSLTKEWTALRPFAGVLGRSIDGELMIYEAFNDAKPERVERSLFVSNDAETRTEMMALLRESLRRSDSNLGLVHTINVDTLTGMRQILIANERQRNNDRRKKDVRLVAIVDLSSLDLSNPLVWSEFVRLMDPGLRSVGIHVVLIGDTKIDRYLSLHADGLIGRKYMSGTTYNELAEKEETVDPFNRPFPNEWVQIIGDEQGVFLPAKLREK